MAEEKPIVLDKSKAITMPIDKNPVDVDVYKWIQYEGVRYLLQNFKNWITERREDARD